MSIRPYYERDGITIYHGDCREIVPSLPVADLVLTDPPYGISEPGSSIGILAGKGSKRLDFFAGDSDHAAMRSLVREACALALDRLKPTGSAYFWCGHRSFGDLVDLCEARGMTTRFVVWRKAVPLPFGAGWSSAAELCVYGYPPGRTWTVSGEAPPNVIDSDSYRHGQPGKLAHPTQKPTRVIRPLLLYSTNPGDLVIDTFAGSGTTLDVCAAEGRRAIGIEIEERYCEIAAKRLAQGVLPLAEAKA